MEKKKLIIIGGGFCGSFIARKLESRFDTTLIDRKDFFEFTPGILRAIVEPKHLSSLQIKHKNYLKKTTFIKGDVISIHENNISVEIEQDEKIEKRNISFDYLVIASGSSYHAPIKYHTIVNSSNSKLLKDNYDSLCKAKKILIIGGGIVGVELAGEIINKYSKEIKSKKKELTLIHSRMRLLNYELLNCSKYVEDYLKKKGVKIILNKRGTLEDAKNYDLTFYATGIRPNSRFLGEEHLDSNNYIKVDKFLQVKNMNNVFAGGDVTNINEEKLAQNAELHAKIIINNLIALDEENKEKMIRYNSSSRLKIISLGKFDGVAIYKKQMRTGMIPAILKYLVEIGEMIKIRF